MKTNNNKFLQALVSLLAGLSSEKEIKELLIGLLTPAELEEIPRRLEIINRLKQGIPQQQIAKDLGVGVATVTRGAKELKLGRFR